MTIRSGEVDLELAKAIRDTRELLGLRQIDLAERLGVKKGIVSNWERGTNRPSDPNLSKLIVLLDLDYALPQRNAQGRRSNRNAVCPSCGQEFPVYFDEHYCSRRCSRVALSEAHSGDQAFNWQGGRSYTPHGYVLLYMPDHPNATGNGYVLEHRWMMAEHLGRPLTKGETVHHKNGDRADNRLENLELFAGKHTPGQRTADLAVDLLRKLSAAERAAILAQFVENGG